MWAGADAGARFSTVLEAASFTPSGKEERTMLFPVRRLFDLQEVDLAELNQVSRSPYNTISARFVASGSKHELLPGIYSGSDSKSSSFTEAGLF